MVNRMREEIFQKVLLLCIYIIVYNNFVPTYLFGATDFHWFHLEKTRNFNAISLRSRYSQVLSLKICAVLM